MTSDFTLTVPVKRLDPGLPLPSYAHPGDAGLDLYAREDAELAPGQRRRVCTGIALALPSGYVGFVVPRSGLAATHGVTTVNSPGTIDAGYRGEIMVTLVNLDRSASYTVNRGDRIAQLVIERIEQAQLVEVDQLEDTDRGAGGFGSTGGF